VFAAHREVGALRTHAHIEDRPGPEGNLGQAAAGASLPEQRRLLIPDDAGQERRTRQGDGFADDLGGVDQTGGGALGNPQAGQPCVVPGATPTGIQSGDAGVGPVRHVERAPAEVPHDPAVDRAPTKVAGPVGGVGIKEPRDLGGALIGSQTDPLSLQLEAGPDGAQVLPAEPRAEGPPGVGVPQHRRSPLIGHPDGVDRSGFGDHCGGCLEDHRHHLIGVELHQPGKRDDRRQPPSLHGVDCGVRLNEGGPHAAGPHVDDQDARDSPSAGD
jgi:hypothetical protein